MCICLCRFISHLVYHSVNFNEEHKMFLIKINIIAVTDERHNTTNDIHSFSAYLSMLKIKFVFMISRWTQWRKNAIQEHINFNAHETHKWRAKEKKTTVNTIRSWNTDDDEQRASKQKYTIALYDEILSFDSAIIRRPYDTRCHWTSGISGQQRKKCHVQFSLQAKAIFYLK